MNLADEEGIGTAARAAWHVDTRLGLATLRNRLCRLSPGFPYPRQRLRRALADASDVHETSVIRVTGFWLEGTQVSLDRRYAHEFGMQPTGIAALC